MYEGAEARGKSQVKCTSYSGQLQLRVSFSCGADPCPDVMLGEHLRPLMSADLIRTGVSKVAPSLGRFWLLDQDDNLNSCVTALVRPYKNATGFNTNMMGLQGWLVNFRSFGIYKHHELLWTYLGRLCFSSSSANIYRTLLFHATWVVFYTISIIWSSP